MVSLSRISYGESPISSAKINAIIDTLSGAQNTPVSLTAANDPVNFALTVRNQDTAGKAVLLYKSDGATVLLQAQNSGVQVSPDGTAAAPAVSTTHTQTLTNKTLTSPVINGTLSGTAGFGAWTTFVPTLTQSAAITFSNQVARYTQIGKIVIGSWWVRISNSGTPGNSIVVGGFPLPLLNNGEAVAHGYFVRSGALNYNLTAIYASASTTTLVSGSGATNSFGIDAAVTLQSGDQIGLTFLYETS